MRGWERKGRVSDEDEDEGKVKGGRAGMRTVEGVSERLRF